MFLSTGYYGDEKTTYEPAWRESKLFGILRDTGTEDYGEIMESYGEKA